jgi:hypothetical protein
MTVNLLYIARMVQYTKGDASVIVSLQMMTVKMKTAFVIKMMTVQQYF